MSSTGLKRGGREMRDRLVLGVAVDPRHDRRDKPGAIHAASIAVEAWFNASVHHGQRPPASMPMPAGRFTAVPRIPPPYLLPITIHGYLATVTVHQGGVRIQSSFLGMLNLNRASAVGWNQIVAIHFVPPNIVRIGYIHFAIPGDPQRLGTFSNGRGSANRHPRAILFRWQNRHAYRQLRHLLVGASPLQYRPG